MGAVFETNHRNNDTPQPVIANTDTSSADSVDGFSPTGSFRRLTIVHGHRSIRMEDIAEEGAASISTMYRRGGSRHEIEAATRRTLVNELTSTTLTEALVEVSRVWGSEPNLARLLCDPLINGPGPFDRDLGTPHPDKTFLDRALQCFFFGTDWATVLPASEVGNEAKAVAQASTEIIAAKDPEGRPAVMTAAPTVVDDPATGAYLDLTAEHRQPPTGVVDVADRLGMARATAYRRMDHDDLRKRSADAVAQSLSGTSHPDPTRALTEMTDRLIAECILRPWNVSLMADAWFGAKERPALHKRSSPILFALDRQLGALRAAGALSPNAGRLEPLLAALLVFPVSGLVANLQVDNGIRWTTGWLRFVLG